jgi:hypothetical protein
MFLTAMKYRALSESKVCSAHTILTLTCMATITSSKKAKLCQLAVIKFALIGDTMSRSDSTWV